MHNDSWTFFQAFLRSPRVIASVVPSSTFLERRVVRSAELETARVIVEFGAGTGGITRALLAAMKPGSRLLAIEWTDAFVTRLSDIGDPRLEIVHGCASTVGAALADRGLDAADAIVSGIPFSTLPRTLALDIAAAVHASLAPGGRFVAYQFSPQVASYIRPLMGEPGVEHELLNVPPMRVCTWRKKAAGHPQHRHGTESELNGSATIDSVIRG